MREAHQTTWSPTKEMAAPRVLPMGVTGPYGPIIGCHRKSLLSGSRRAHNPDVLRLATSAGDVVPSLRSAR